MIPATPLPEPNPLRERLEPSLMQLFPLYRVETLVSHKNTDDDNIVIMIRLSPDPSK